MTQYIAPNMAMAMQYSNQQGMDPSNRYGSGILSLADGGFIGGGSIQGQAMPGGRTGYGNPFKKIYKAVTKPFIKVAKKVVPKELAGIMQIGAPFAAGAGHPYMAAILSAAGQARGRGKINPLQTLLSTAPGWTNEGMAGISGGRLGQTGAAGGDSWLRTQMGKWGPTKALEGQMFGTPAVEIGGPANMYGGPGTSGWFGDKGITGAWGGAKDLLKKGGEMILFKDSPTGGRELDKMALAALALGGMSYIEAKKQFDLAGEDMEDYGIFNEADYEATDWTGWAEGTHLEGAAKMAQGGLARLGHAMGSAQFPPQKRTGLQWGSDKGEGLGGEEGEADMRYTGGFMPYGDKPKADDVPARLSKDEFVFTDEAVAGAGQGDVNVGAERLYNIMKQLEQTGAQNMEGIFNNPLSM